jgi:phosphoesterase RecJ-like protein
MMTNPISNKIIEILKEKNSFLITAHVYPDGDSLGTMLALGFFLKEKLGKQVDMAQDGQVPEIYQFLPRWQEIKDKNQLQNRYDVLIALECPSPERMGTVLEKVRPGHLVINIDHHKDNQLYGDINWLNAKASAVGELIYEIIYEIDSEALTPEMAVCLYTAMFTDTGGFHYSNTTGNTLRYCADLLDRKVNGWEIARKVYHTSPYNKTRLLGKMMAGIRVIHHGKVAYGCITRQMFAEYGCSPNDTEGFVNPVRAVEGIEIGILFQETLDGKTKASFRSVGQYDVAELAKKFGGGGHAMAAGATIEGPISVVTESVLENVVQWMES